MIYENNVLKRILVDGGYYENGTYYFYLTDHLGDNRVVANQNGAVIQSTQYYPFGMAFADGTDPSAQPYKFGGKELDSDRGLNLYDSHARWQDAALGGRFLPVDPLAEKYYWISPYAYVANNPVRFVDLNGDSISVNQMIYDDYVLNASFEVFVTSKQGKAFLANYASKGQTLYGHTSTKDGQYHKRGVNLDYTIFYSEDAGSRGRTDTSSDGTIAVGINSFSEVNSQDDKSYSWSAYPKMSDEKKRGIMSRTITFFHESFIHADLSTKDFIGDGLFNYSNISSDIIKHNRKYTSSNAHLQHHAVYHNSDSQLWPGAAYRGILGVNASLKLNYTAPQLKTMMWNYLGGR